MRIARYSVDDVIRYGVVELEEDGTGNPDTVCDLTGDPFSGSVKLTGARHDLEAVRLLAPVIPRSKVVGIAKNCVPGQDNPEEPASIPAFFLKPNTSVIGPGEAIQVPQLSTDTVLEAEVAIVIGRICRSVPVERVPEVVFGYTCVNDVTASDQIQDGIPWGAAKSWDTFTPIGPWIVTHLSLEEASSLRVAGRVDGEAVTVGSMKGLIHGIANLVSFISSVTTLLPGDLILAGAPGGTAPIRPGDEVTIDIEEIGRLANPVIGEA